MRIENIEERHFYEIEAVKNNWSLRELNRQFDAALYERLALSTNKKNITISQSGTDCRKVLGHCERSLCVGIFRIGRKSKYSESNLETHLIDNLQKFLLELGAGYTFVARQKRFTFSEDHFRVDLVFYSSCS